MLLRGFINMWLGPALVSYSIGLNVLLSDICKLSVCNMRVEHCDTSQKEAGSIPDGVIGIFH